MRKLLTLFFLSVTLLLITGCGGGTYDDSLSVYEPTITLNETIIDNDKYTLTIIDIINKTHKDVGNITEINFQYNNKTDQDLYLTTDHVQFDGKTVDDPVMAFFESMPPNSNGTIMAHFNDIRDNDWSFSQPKQSVFMKLDIVDAESSESIDTYEMNLAFPK